MTGHARNEARSAGKGGPLRRAWIAAWTVATTMAATTMGFQVYHALKWGHEPWGVAYPVGIVPLLISLCILEIVAEWRDAPGWAKAGAYAIMGGAMFLSASATGKVVLASSPPHMSLLFGLLLDGAALLAVHFILNGPRKADEQAAAEAARRAAAERAEAGEAASLRRQLADVSAQHAAGVSDLRARLDEALSALGEARRESAQALTRAEALQRKLDAASDRKPRKPAAAAKGKGDAAQDGDVTTELRALMELQADAELCKPRMGGELARRLGVSAATGRRLHSRLTHEGSLNESVARSLTDGAG